MAHKSLLVRLFRMTLRHRFPASLVPLVPDPRVILNLHLGRDTPEGIQGSNISGLRSPKNPALSLPALLRCRLRRCLPFCPLRCLVPQPAQTAQTPWVRRVEVKGMQNMMGMCIVSSVILSVLGMI
jgi:hypothetical protein